MQRYFIQLAYDGTRYHGWQYQPNAETIQGTLERALEVLLHQAVQLTGAGRTDSGVHASNYFAHMDLEQELNDCDALCFRLNRFLPADIVIKRIFKVALDVHARYSALSRTYHYHISSVKPLYNRGYAHYIYGKLDLDRIEECCKVLKETEDFTSFSKLHTDVKNNLCKISHISWVRLDEGYRFEITANRFLRDMVRAITGTLLEAGEGKITLEEFRRIIEAKDRSAAGNSIAAKGLFLASIVYPDGIVP